jgi:hypothetical protein
MVAGLHRHLHADAAPPVEARADGEDDPVLGWSLVLARRQQQAGPTHPVGLQFLDDDLIEERPQLLSHAIQDKTFA